MNIPIGFVRVITGIIQKDDMKWQSYFRLFLPISPVEIGMIIKEDDIIIRKA